MRNRLLSFNTLIQHKPSPEEIKETRCFKKIYQIYPKYQNCTRVFFYSITCNQYLYKSHVQILWTGLDYVAKVKATCMFSFIYFSDCKFPDFVCETYNWIVLMVCEARVLTNILNYGRPDGQIVLTAISQTMSITTDWRK